VGTSGWNYRHWRGRFYPGELPVRGWFGHYSEVFDTVEVNNTFYRLPEAKTFEAWRDQAPSDFCYAVKANRFITHIKKLKDVKEPLSLFLERARRLGTHLGPILYQLPPHWGPDIRRLEAFCDALPGDLTHVVEFRERGWLSEEVYEVLEERMVSLCIHDLLKRHPRRLTGKVVYVRFHGAGAKYGGSYSNERLRRWAGWLRRAAGEGRDVYVYFNNDADAHAVENATTLAELLGVRLARGTTARVREVAYQLNMPEPPLV
jgi:uncharacterized protein YecE (DUF72 family)